MHKITYVLPPTDLAGDDWLRRAAAEVALTSINGRVALVARTMEVTARHLGVPIEGALAAEIDHIWDFVENADLSTWEQRATEARVVEDWFEEEGPLPDRLEPVPVPLLRMIVWARATALAHAYAAIQGVGEASLQCVLLTLREARLAGATPPDPAAFATASPFRLRDTPEAWWCEWGRPTKRAAFPRS